MEINKNNEYLKNLDKLDGCSLVNFKFKFNENVIQLLFKSVGKNGEKNEFFHSIDLINCLTFNAMNINSSLIEKVLINDVGLLFQLYLQKNLIDYKSYTQVEVFFKNEDCKYVKDENSDYYSLFLVAKEVVVKFDISDPEPDFWFL
ncbi:hypothetical protein ACI6Q2_08770 [Chitinophagaceae bacterium LWZ2-11]